MMWIISLIGIIVGFPHLFSQSSGHLSNRHIVVLVDLSLSAGREACQRDPLSIAEVVSKLHASHPRWEISLYITSAPNAAKGPIHVKRLLELKPLNTFYALTLKDVTQRRKYRTKSQKILLEKLNLLGQADCDNCSSLKYAIYEILQYERKIDLVILLSDGKDEGPSLPPLKLPILIAGTPAQKTLEIKIARLWKGWNAWFLHVGCDPEKIEETTKEILKKGEIK